jgi:hypothetical protein
MLTFNETGRQISPCIAAKARFALNNKRNEPKNEKRCSKDYWKNVIETLCKNDPSLEQNKEKAKDMYNLLIEIV